MSPQKETKPTAQFSESRAPLLPKGVRNDLQTLRFYTGTTSNHIHPPRLELGHPSGHRILSPERLPIPPWMLNIMQVE